MVRVFEITIKHDDGKSPIPKYVNFIFAGISGMLAICITQPADLLKTRMQLLRRGSTQGLRDVHKDVIKESGYHGYYKGLSAALFRQCTYTSGRLGVFNALHDWYHEKFKEAPSYRTMIIMGMCGGVVGSFIGNPAEMALIRMTADGMLPMEKRRNYKNVFNALSRICKEEGVVTLWRGCTTTVIRSAIVNGSQLSTYTQAREMLKPVIGDGPHLHFLSALISAVVTVMVSMPVDNIKTKVQNAKRKASPVTIFAKTIRHEGVLALWQGMVPLYLKMAPHNILVFIFFEQMQNIYRKVLTD